MTPARYFMLRLRRERSSLLSMLRSPRSNSRGSWGRCQIVTIGTSKIRLVRTLAPVPVSGRGLATHVFQGTLETWLK
jgi:hypothetical protein